MLLFLIVVLLLAPVVICNAIDGVLARMVVVVLSTTILLSIVSILMSVRTIELILAGATCVAPHHLAQRTIAVLTQKFIQVRNGHGRFRF